MANNELKPFAYDDAANVVSASAWEEATTLRSKGFQSGVARSDQINRAVAQGANVGYAVGELIKDYANETATIKPAPLYASFKKALEQFVKRQVIGFIYPVGAIFATTVPTNPAVLFGVGVWERIGEGRGLIDAGSNYPAGSTGGSETHVLTEREMPAHSHSGSTNTTGAHTHARGSMNITGRIGAIAEEGTNYTSGAFYQDGSGGTGHGGGWDQFVYMNAARNWTGETSSNGNHSHIVSVEKAGGGQAMNIRNPYLAVYIWKRVS